MTQTFEDTPEPSFSRPAGLTKRIVCRESGQLATAACMEVGEELFVESIVPTRLCELHQPGSGAVPAEGGDFEDIDKQASHADEFNRSGDDDGSR